MHVARIYGTGQIQTEKKIISWLFEWIHITTNITSKNKQQEPTEVVKQVADFNNDEIVIVAMQCCLWTSYDFLFNKIIHITNIIPLMSCTFWLIRCLVLEQLFKLEIDWTWLYNTRITPPNLYWNCFFFNVLNCAWTLVLLKAVSKEFNSWAYKFSIAIKHFTFCKDSSNERNLQSSNN